MTGNSADAKQALRDFLSGEDSRVLSFDGSTRVVYLIDGIVYKIEIEEFDSPNETEIKNIRETVLPDGVFYPSTDIYYFGNTSVIAMDYIEGTAVAECFCVEPEVCDDSCMPNDVWEKVNGILGDTGGFNVILNNEGIWIIDAAA